MTSGELNRLYDESYTISVDFFRRMTDEGYLSLTTDGDSVKVEINRELQNFKYKNQCEYLSVVGDIAFLPQVQLMRQFIQHSDITRIRHMVSVSYMSFFVAREEGIDFTAAARGALLHDLFYYDWHTRGDGSHRLHGYRHAAFALKNAERLVELTEKERDIIRRHMWPLTVTPPKYRESMIVSNMDKFCSSKETVKANLRISEIISLWNSFTRTVTKVRD